MRVSEHPIQGLMKTAMESIQAMIDVNTVIGDAVETPGGGVIIPVSRVSFGFAAGGGEYQAGTGLPRMGERKEEWELPFGGGSGAGVSVQPVAFLIVDPPEIRLLCVQGNPMADRLIDMAPQLVDQIGSLIRGKPAEREVALRTSGSGSRLDD